MLLLQSTKTCKPKIQQEKATFPLINCWIETNEQTHAFRLGCHWLMINQWPGLPSCFSSAQT